MQNIRQRMESIGGELHLRTQPGKGTEVRLEYALPKTQGVPGDLETYPSW